VRHRVGVTLTLVVPIMLLAITAAASARAGSRADPSGDRINLFGITPMQIESGSPFYVQHGWHINPRTDPPLARLPFRLEVDGTPQRPDNVNVRLLAPDERTVPDEWLEITYLFNFEAGLEEGTHDLHGTWLAPCWWAESEGLINDGCGAGANRYRLVAAVDIHFELVVGDATPTLSDGCAELNDPIYDGEYLSLHHDRNSEIYMFFNPGEVVTISAAPPPEVAGATLSVYATEDPNIVVPFPGEITHTLPYGGGYGFAWDVVSGGGTSLPATWEVSCTG
jgi:hypothetical protein